MKMWSIDIDKVSKISAIELRKLQKENSKKVDDIVSIPRLSWDEYEKGPTTTDTLASLYSKEFKNLDKLDNIINNKGYSLDKDITVTRRVANLGVIKNQIENSGKYTQYGITSTSASKSISKKMPSGISMGDDLLRITIPKGTKVLSTYNAISHLTQKQADKYSGGKLTSDDMKNLNALKKQNEIILPSGSSFISPDGKKLTQNQDRTYKLILAS